MLDRLTIATRSSALALWQAEHVAALLREAHPGLEVVLETFTTVGDRTLDTSLDKIGDRGLFTKELEGALLDGRAQIAVHSLKDMQTTLPEGLTIAAVTERHGAEDVLVAPPGTTLASLPEGATVATGSVRRRAQLLALRPDLNIVDLRGNIQTRLRRLHENGWAGAILARAGMERLGLDNQIAQIIPTELMLPAVGQGALAIESRADDPDVLNLLAPLEHRATRAAVDAERAFLRHLEGGCHTPIAAYATVAGDLLHLDGLIAAHDGSTVARSTIDGGAGDAEQIGVELAERVRSASA